jgi:hypothetical protein
MQSKSIDDGGPAFPVNDVRGIPIDTEAEMVRLVFGMTLRDYFAASVRIDEYLTNAESKWHYDKLGQILTGRECPNALDDPFEHARWWIEVDAHIRFMAADAMIKARKA